MKKTFRFYKLLGLAVMTWILIAIVLILIFSGTSALSGCSPAEIRITEEVVEDVAEKELKQNEEGK